MTEFTLQRSDPFESALLTAWPRERWGRFRMVLAVSGGADSVALFRSFCHLAQNEATLTGKKLTEGRSDNDPSTKGETSTRQSLKSRSIENILVVHVDHGLRGEESRGDALFVRSLAEHGGVPYREERISPEEMVAETEKEGSLEGAARNLRYRLLLKNAQEFGARFILTAHHADDQIETILHRFFRGSGIDGLTGMNRFRPLNEAVVLVRPMLTFSRREILDYLARLGQPFRTDSSNQSLEFLRNRIRNELVPLLADLFPGRFDQAVLRLGDRCREIQDWIDGAVTRESLAKGFVFPTLSPPSKEESATPIRIPLDILTSESEFWVREFFRKLWKAKSWPLGAMNAKRWEGLAKMALHRTPKIRELPGNIVARIIDDRIEIGPSFPESFR